MSLNALEKEVFFSNILITAPAAYIIVDFEIEMAVEAKGSDTLPLVCLKYFPCLQRLLTSIATDGSFSLSECAETQTSRCVVCCSEGAETQTSSCVVCCSEGAETQTLSCVVCCSEIAYA